MSILDKINGWLWEEDTFYKNLENLKFVTFKSLFVTDFSQSVIKKIFYSFTT